MPEFILDHGSPEASRTFASLDRFTQGYVEALFWTSTDDGNGGTNDWAFSDLASGALQQIIEDCRQFQADNAADLADIDAAQAGHDFLLTRNHHGAGFWDRGHGPKGERLTNAAHAYGASDAYLGDDGHVYVS